MYRPWGYIASGITFGSIPSEHIEITIYKTIQNTPRSPIDRSLSLALSLLISYIWSDFKNCDDETCYMGALIKDINTKLSTFSTLLSLNFYFQRNPDYLPA
jgi:hypothetical protein